MQREEKDAIWEIYLRQFELDHDRRLPDNELWTGAEVRACCRLAVLLDVPLAQVAQNVVPVAVTSAESVQRLRTWASGRCLNVNCPGIYACTSPASSSKARRKILRDSTLN